MPSIYPLMKAWCRKQFRRDCVFTDHRQGPMPELVRSTCRQPQVLYRRRNLIERLYCRLNNWRRLATRYDRLARNYLGALALIAVVTVWI